MTETRRPDDFISALVLFHNAYSLTTILLKVSYNIAFPYLFPQSGVPFINIFAKEITYKFIILLELCCQTLEILDSFVYITK
jgi:hypothetical protein